MLQKRLTGSPAGGVLSAMQRQGQVTVKDLEEALNVTATAVRQQLAALLAEGYISQGAENIGRGRPKHVYALTAKGRALFPSTTMNSPTRCSARSWSARGRPRCRSCWAA